MIIWIKLFARQFFPTSFRAKNVLFFLKSALFAKTLVLSTFLRSTYFIRNPIEWIRAVTHTLLRWMRVRKSAWQHPVRVLSIRWKSAFSIDEEAFLEKFENHIVVKSASVVTVQWFHEYQESSHLMRWKLFGALLRYQAYLDDSLNLSNSEQWRNC